MNNDTLRISKVMMSDRSSQRTSTIARIALALLAGVVFVACGGDEGGQGEADTKPVPGEWVVVHELSDPEGLNPVVTNDASASAIFNQVFERLLDQDFKTHELVPELAEARPIISEDHLSYTFTLQKGAAFSDGHPLTTKDVLFSFKAVMNPLIIDAAPLRNYFNDVKDVVAVDDRTFVVNMLRPYFLAEVQLSLFWIMPKHILDPKSLTDKYGFDLVRDIDIAQKDAACSEFATWFNTAEVKRGTTQNIGSGPYIFDSWTTGEAVIVKRNNKWWRAGKSTWEPAYPDKIIYKVMTDRNTAVVALKNQELDFMEFVPPPKFTEEVDTVAVPHLSKHAYEWQVYTYIGWNTANPVLADKRVRRALTHLVDRDALIKQILRGLAVPLNSPVYPNSVEYDKTIAPIAYDPAKARQLLAEAGWADADQDGFLDKDINGKRTNLTFKFLLNAGNEAREQVALILVDEFKKVGIKAEIQKLEWAVFLDDLRDRKFDCYIGSWVNDPIPTDPYQLWHSSQTTNNGSNYTNFKNARVDELIELNRLEFDPEKRKEYLKEFQRIVVEEQPYTFLWMPLSPAVFNKRLHNVNFSFVRPGYNPSQWWVSKSQWRLAAAP